MSSTAYAPPINPPPAVVIAQPLPSSAVTTVVEEPRSAPVKVVTETPAPAPPASKPEVIVTSSVSPSATQAAAVTPDLQDTTGTYSAETRSAFTNPNLLLIIIIALFCPPAAAFAARGCGLQLLINIFLTIVTLGFGGLIHAIWLAVHEDPVAVKKRALRRTVRRQKMEAEKEAIRVAVEQMLRSRRPQATPTA